MAPTMEVMAIRRLLAMSVPPLKRYKVRDDIRETLLAGYACVLYNIVNTTRSAESIPEEVSHCDGSRVTILVLITM